MLANPFTGEVAINRQSGGNCGIGPGGFQQGNKCQKGGGGKSGKGGKGKRLSIVDAAAKLATKGYEFQGKGETNLVTKTTSYKVKTPGGKVRTMTTTEIKSIIGD